MSILKPKATAIKNELTLLLTVYKEEVIYLNVEIKEDRERLVELANLFLLPRVDNYNKTRLLGSYHPSAVKIQTVKTPTGTKHFIK